MTPRLALDTNAYRALDDGNATLSGLIQTTPQVGLPIIVLGELYHGIFSGNKSERNLDRLGQFLNSPRVEILVINDSTAKLFGEIATELKRLGRPVQQNDIWIAALCKQHDYRLATADSGFQAVVGLETLLF